MPLHSGASWDWEDGWMDWESVYNIFGENLHGTSDDSATWVTS